MTWSGVFPAVTTNFHEDESLDLDIFEKNVAWQVDSGVHGIIVCGSLGENGVLTADEKQEVIRAAVRAADGRVPVLATVAETTTRQACTYVEDAQVNGAQGFMCLPGMQYVADSREVEAHLRAVAQASDYPIMVYNNPVAYRMDISPEMFAELADEPKFTAIKESSDDVRRITELINLTGDRYDLFCGVDNLALEALLMGATGWVAGLVCAFPKETVAIYELAQAGRLEEARDIYRWFAPLLDLDVSTKLVQNIKLAETAVGMGSPHVRRPRLPLDGAERARVEAVIRDGLAKRPDLGQYGY